MLLVLTIGSFTKAYVLEWNVYVGRIKKKKDSGFKV